MNDIQSVFPIEHNNNSNNNNNNNNDNNNNNNNNDNDDDEWMNECVDNQYSICWKSMMAVRNVLTATQISIVCKDGGIDERKKSINTYSVLLSFI